MEQLYYTQCPAGYGLGLGSGFQIKRQSPGYPSSGDFRHLGFRPFLPGTQVLAPPALRYRQDGQAAEIAWLTPRASEYETEQGLWGRPGGCFAHCIRLESEEFAAISNWAAGLFDGAFWRRSDPVPTQGRSPDPFEFGPAMLTRAPDFAEVAPLADQDDVVRLARLLTAMAWAVKEDRTLLLIDRADRLADRVALLTFAFPSAMRPFLSFSTYHGRPQELTGFRIQGTIPEARPNRDAIAALGMIANLIEGTFQPRIEPARWAMVLARWLVRRTGEDAKAWKEMNHRAGKAQPSDLQKRIWSDAWLDRLVGLQPSRRPSVQAPNHREPDLKNSGKELDFEASPPAGSFAATRLGTLFEKRGLSFLEEPLRCAEYSGMECVADEAWYQEHVIDPAWKGVPLLFRLLGRDRLHWDRFLQRLRVEVYEPKSGEVTLRQNWEQIVLRVLNEPIEAELVSDVGTMPHPTQASRQSPHPQAVSHVESSLGATTTANTARTAQSRMNGHSEINSSLAVGIDLGTIYSTVAHLDRQGRPTTLVNSNGDLLTPSVVLFDDEEIVIGREAVVASAMEPQKVADCVKRDMGAKAYRKLINNESLRPEVISSFILSKLKVDAERRLGPIHQAVITVPAYFDEPRRRATADAGRLAGLQVLDIINEPTAAALTYGHQLGRLDGRGRLRGERPLTVLVYDLGGGTFDVSIIRIRGDEVRTLATDGDVRLGGKCWDDALVEMAAEHFRVAHREDPRENPVSLQELYQAAEACKKTLSERSKAVIYVNHLGLRHKVEITREEFEELTAGLLGRTRITTEAVVLQAGLTWPEIDVVLTVGGSTRMPMVVRMLQEMAGKEPDQSVSADEAVAHGAALYADLLLQKLRDGGATGRFSIVNVNSHSLGVAAVDPKTHRRVNKVLIPKNTPLPHTVVRRFKTLRQGQRNIQISILEGESEFPEACTRIGKCVIRSLPIDLPSGWPVEVRYTYAEDGRLRVSGSLVGHQATVTTEFVRDQSLSDEELGCN